MSIGTSIGDWLGSFMAALLFIPVACALQVIVRELWQATAWREPLGGKLPADPEPAVGDGGREANEDKQLAL
jgi:hypothetical protein